MWFLEKYTEAQNLANCARVIPIPVFPGLIYPSGYCPMFENTALGNRPKVQKTPEFHSGNLLNYLENFAKFQKKRLILPVIQGFRNAGKFREN